MRYLLILILCAGCQTKIVTDKVYFVDKGAKVETTEGTITVEDDSVLIKETTLQEMFDTKMEK